VIREDLLGHARLILGRRPLVRVDDDLRAEPVFLGANNLVDAVINFGIMGSRKR